MPASTPKACSSQVTAVLEAAATPSSNGKSIAWSVRRGRRMAPRFSPENIWFTPRSIAQKTRIPEDHVAELLEADQHFVRASNIEAEGNEPVYAVREIYLRRTSPVGRLTSVLVNRIVG